MHFFNFEGCTGWHFWDFFIIYLGLLRSVVCEVSMCQEYFLIFQYRNFDFRNKFFIVRILEKLISIILFPETNRQWLERRFLANDPIRIVFDYLTVEGYPTEEFKVLSSWPRRDVSYKSFE
jgi:hypothetical protein